MATKKLVCKLPHEWGGKVNVNGTIVDIDPKDGSVLVDEQHAAKLLANVEKWGEWADPASRQPGKRPPSLPNAVILMDGNGNVVPSEGAPADPPPVKVEMTVKVETLDLYTAIGEAVYRVAKEHGMPEEEAADLARKAAALTRPPPTVEPTKLAAAAKPDDMPPEDPPADWPEVSMRNTRDELVAVLARLKEAKHSDFEVTPKTPKADLLEAIEDAYGTLA